MSKTLDMQIKEVNGKLAEIYRLINENGVAAAAAEARLGSAKGRLSEITAEKDEARTARQKALASGEDPGAFGKRLKDLEEERELREDEIAGLTTRLGQLAGERASLKRERQAETRKVPMAKLRDVAQELNVIFQQAAPLLERFWSLRRELGEPVEGKVVHTPRGITGALECLPRLFIPGTPEFFEVGDQEKHFYFDGPGLREKRAVRVRPLLVDEAPPASETGAAS